MKYLANVDGWQLRLVVSAAFQQKAGAGKGNEEGKCHQHNAKPSALWRRFYSLNQFFERGFHQRMLNEDSATGR